LYKILIIAVHLLLNITYGLMLFRSPATTRLAIDIHSPSSRFI